MLAPVTEIFCDIDDFCKDYLKNQSAFLLPNPDRKRDREMQMSLSEIGTIIILFQTGFMALNYILLSTTMER